MNADRLDTMATTCALHAANTRGHARNTNARQIHKGDAGWADRQMGEAADLDEAAGLLRAWAVRLRERESGLLDARSARVNPGALNCSSTIVETTAA